jgi:hypothetical protein
VTDAHAANLRIANIAKGSEITPGTTFVWTKELRALLETPQLALLLLQSAQTAGLVRVGGKKDTTFRKKTEETLKVSAIKVHALDAGA